MVYLFNVYHIAYIHILCVVWKCIAYDAIWIRPTIGHIMRIKFRTYGN
jgi:hypothetical protein